MNPQNTQLAIKQAERLEDDYVELSTYDLIPINIAKIRRDTNSAHGKIRKKYINLSSNIRPTKILVNNTECSFKITRGHNLIKVDMGEILCSKESGNYDVEIKLIHSDGVLVLKTVVEFRARGHYRKIRSHDSGDTGNCNQ